MDHEYRSEEPYNWSLSKADEFGESDAGKVSDGAKTGKCGCISFTHCLPCIVKLHVPAYSSA